jgi:hypothetical protein
VNSTHSDPNAVDKILARWNALGSFAHRYSGYTEFLTSLARGERLPAHHTHLRPLIEWLTTSAFDVRYEFVHAICLLVDFDGRQARTSPVPCVPFDLIEKIAIPTLVEATKRDDQDAYALLWLAMLPSNQHYPSRPNPSELIHRAHLLAPNDEFVATRLADDLHHAVWFACHHLPDGLLGSRQTVLRDISNLRRIADNLGSERANILRAAADEYKAMVDAYVEVEPNASGNHESQISR